MYNPASGWHVLSSLVAACSQSCVINAYPGDSTGNDITGSRCHSLLPIHAFNSFSSVQTLQPVKEKSRNRSRRKLMWASTRIESNIYPIFKRKNPLLNSWSPTTKLVITLFVSNLRLGIKGVYNNSAASTRRDNTYRTICMHFFKHVVNPVYCPP